MELKQWSPAALKKSGLHLVVALMTIAASSSSHDQNVGA